MKKHETRPIRNGLKALKLHKETIRLLEERTDLVHVVGGTGSERPSCNRANPCFEN